MGYGLDVPMIGVGIIIAGLGLLLMGIAFFTDTSQEELRVMSVVALGGILVALGILVSK